MKIEEYFKAVNEKIKDGKLINKMINDFNESEVAKDLQAEVKLQDYIYSAIPRNGYTSVLAIVIYSSIPNTFVDNPNIRKTGFIVGTNGIELDEGIATFGGDISNKQFSLVTMIFHKFNALIYRLLTDVMTEENERQLRA